MLPIANQINTTSRRNYRYAYFEEQKIRTSLTVKKLWNYFI